MYELGDLSTSTTVQQNVSKLTFLTKFQTYTMALEHFTYTYLQTKTTNVQADRT